MPIYCYKCNVCQLEVEVEQKINDYPPPCPDDGVGGPHEMKRQISSTSFILKGTNWYRDGYSSSKKSGKV